MSAIKTEDEKVLTNKKLVHEMCKQDGGLVSPIDLTLDATKPLQLQPLQWFNFEESPSRMKLTNSGDTLVISAKWLKERPFVEGGPLEGNYVFSQIHFHWGSTEHEGSEHKVGGICYPMEMHVVFFKTRYLTQAAALKQDDGVVILAYLFKLQSRSTPGIHWLASQLENVVEPRTSTLVSPMPIASLLVPFDADYMTYWGALVSQNCRHPVMWLVSRSALAVTSEDLNLFRCLMNSRNEAMTKNFRATSPAGGRAIFHINPSTDCKNLLLPGAVDPPCKAVVVSFSHTPPVHQTEAKKIFNKGDSNELETKDSLKNKYEKEGQTHLKHEGTPKKYAFVTEIGPVLKKKKKSESNDSEVLRTVRSPSSQLDKKPNAGTKLQRQCTMTKKFNSTGKARKNNKEQTSDCVHINANPSYIVASTSTNERKAATGLTIDNMKKKVEVNKTKKSRLPVPKAKPRAGKQLESRYASYFQRPDSAPTKIANVETKITKNTTLQETTSKPVTPSSESGTMKTTTIPRPSTRQGLNKI